MKTLLISLLVVNSFVTYGHNNDTLRLNNGQEIIGEIKILDGGVLTLDTDYDDQKFLIKWNQVQQVRSSSSFIIVLTNKLRVTGRIIADQFRPEYHMILEQEGSKHFVRIKDIVYLKSTESRLIDRFSANIDGGYNITKASNTKQFSLSGKFSYTYTKLYSDFYFNFIDNITQDSIKSQRSNYGTNWKVFFLKSWYALGAVDFLESDEQNLDLRTTTQLGIGKFLLRNFKLYTSAAVGLAQNSEEYFSIETPSQKTLEGFAEVELYIYGIKDLRIFSKIQYFPSFSQENRNRFNLSLDSKLDLPFDFYLGFYSTYNFDSSPNENAEKSDYVLQSTVGWKF
ncbi:MAG: DUF481 domain-containing protein [Reichenbachiella sp.]